MPAADKRETELMSDARYRFTITVGAEDAGSRLDSWLASVDDPDMREKLVSRSAIQKVIAEGNVLVNGSTATKNMVLKLSPEEFGRIIASAIDQINHGSVETVDALVRDNIRG